MATKKKRAAYTESHKERTPSKVAARVREEGKSTAKRAGSKTVKEVMTPRVIAVTSVTFLPEAAQIMLEEDVGALPVVQEDGKLLGIVTDRDITVRGVAAKRDLDRTQVADVFTAEDLVTIDPESNIEEAERLMEEHQVRRLPVIGTDNRLVGMLSLGDVALEHSDKQSGAVLEQVSKPGGEHNQSQ